MGSNYFCYFIVSSVDLAHWLYSRQTISILLCNFLCVKFTESFWKNCIQKISSLTLVYGSRSLCLQLHFWWSFNKSSKWVWNIEYYANFRRWCMIHKTLIYCRTVFTKRKTKKNKETWKSFESIKSCGKVSRTVVYSELRVLLNICGKIYKKFMVAHHWCGIHLCGRKHNSKYICFVCHNKYIGNGKSKRVSSKSIFMQRNWLLSVFHVSIGNQIAYGIFVFN